MNNCVATPDGLFTTLQINSLDYNFRNFSEYQFVSDVGFYNSYPMYPQFDGSLATPQ